MEAITVLHRREALLDRLTQALPTGVLHVGPDQETLFSNARWFEITGLPSEAAVADLFAILSDAGATEAALQNSVSRGDEFDLDVTLSHTDGTVRHGRLRLGPLDPDDPRDGVLLALEDTTEACLLHEQLADKARRDPLTGLLNRAGILAQLEDALDSRTSDLDSVAVLYLDLDRFKLINDQHSHALGDAVLCAVADKLSELLRPGDHLGRVGGDEFLMVLSEVARPDDAYAIAQRLELAVTDLSIRWQGPVSVEVSAGVALARPGENRDSIVNRADATMYERKATRAAMRQLTRRPVH
jgi:diguanylate cyclase (GGDEF)-like protein